MGLRGLGFPSTPHPALKRWAIIFRPAKRDWRASSGERSAGLISKLRDSGFRLAGGPAFPTKPQSATHLGCPILLALFWREGGSGSSSRIPTLSATESDKGGHPAKTISLEWAWELALHGEDLRC